MNDNAGGDGSQNPPDWQDAPWQSSLAQSSLTSSDGVDQPSAPAPSPTGSGSSAVGGEPSPFSREGSEDRPATSSWAPADAAPPASPAPAPASPPAGSWSGYPPPQSYPEPPFQPPYGAPPAASMNQPSAPGYHTQPTAPYGSVDPHQGYGQPAPAPYGQASNFGSPYGVNPYAPGYGYGPYAMGPVTHPKATQAMVLGIIGLVFTLSWGIGLIPAIFAIVIGRRARADIDADPQRYTGRSMASAGFGLGIAAVVLGGLLLVLVIVLAATGALNS